MSDSTDVLQLIAPPLALLDWLDAHQAKSGTVPAETLDWAQRWKDIRGGGDSVIDGKVGEIVNRLERKAEKWHTVIMAATHTEMVNTSKTDQTHVLRKTD